MEVCKWEWRKRFSRKKKLGHTNRSGSSPHKKLRWREKLTENIFLPYNHSCLLVLQNRNGAEGKPHKGASRCSSCDRKSGNRVKAAQRKQGCVCVDAPLFLGTAGFFSIGRDLHPPPTCRTEDHLFLLTLSAIFLRVQGGICVLYSRVRWINFMECLWETTALWKWIIRGYAFWGVAVA